LENLDSTLFEKTAHDSNKDAHNQSIYVVNSEEKNDWKTKATSLGMCLNDYIRSCVERRKIPTPMPEVNRRTAVELGHIGVNLNQQIRAMNTAIASGQDIPNIEESLAVVEKVYEAVRELQGELLLGEKQSLTSANER
jgi:hypothetical protein